MCFGYLEWITKGVRRAVTLSTIWRAEMSKWWVISTIKKRMGHTRPIVIVMAMIAAGLWAGVHGGVAIQKGLKLMSQRFHLCLVFTYIVKTHALMANGAQTWKVRIQASVLDFQFGGMAINANVPMRSTKGGGGIL